MALLYFDGFAHQQTSRYTNAPSIQWNTSSGRVTNYSVGVNNLTRLVGSTVSDGFMGLGVFYTFQSSGRWTVQFYGDSNVTQHITVMPNGSGLIEVRRGGTGGTLLATGTTVMATSTWYYLEVRVVIHDTTGVVQVRLNGSTTNEINFSGDTKNAGTNNSWDAIRIAGDTSNKMADWYILDSTGSVNNTWLGDVVVRQLVPTGDGDLSGLTGSDGNSVANWQQVDELPGSATDYNGSATAAAEDTYALADLPAGATQVFGVAVCAVMLKSDAGASNAQVIARISGTDYAPGGTRTLSTSAVEYRDVYEASPATSSAWTVSEVNGLQVGMKVA